MRRFACFACALSVSAVLVVDTAQLCAEEEGVSLAPTGAVEPEKGKSKSSIFAFSRRTKVDEVPIPLVEETEPRLMTQDQQQEYCKKTARRVVSPDNAFEMHNSDDSPGALLGVLDSVDFESVENAESDDTCAWTVIWGEPHKRAHAWTRFGKYKAATGRPWELKNGTALGGRWIPAYTLGDHMEDGSAVTPRDSRPIEVYAGDRLAWFGCNKLKSVPAEQYMEEVNEGCTHSMFDKVLTFTGVTFPSVRAYLRPSLPALWGPRYENLPRTMADRIIPRRTIPTEFKFDSFEEKLGGTFRPFDTGKPMTADTRVAVDVTVVQDSFGGACGAQDDSSGAIENCRWTLVTIQDDGTGQSERRSLNLFQEENKGEDDPAAVLTLGTAGEVNADEGSMKRVVRVPIRSGRPWRMELMAAVKDQGVKWNAAGGFESQRSAVTRVFLEPDRGCPAEHSCCTIEPPKPEKPTEAPIEAKPDHPHTDMYWCVQKQDLGRFVLPTTRGHTCKGAGKLKGEAWMKADKQKCSLGSFTVTSNNQFPQTHEPPYKEPWE